VKDNVDVLKTGQCGNYTITCREGSVEPPLVMGQLSIPHGVIRKGRGEIKILSVGDTLLACRKYIHGGLLRGITGDIFFSEKRAARELKITMHLEKNQFPVVSPYGYIAERRCCAKALFFVTFFEENIGDLLEFLKSAGRKERKRVIKKFARLLFEMGRLGVYHPDLHLQNVLVTKTGDLILLDFDKASFKAVTKSDMERMFWRLNRFAEKKENAGELIVTLQEKALFLRTIERLSGYRIIGEMQGQLEAKERSYRLGWFLDSLLYRKETKR
jgi:tRNA A-37 threonylcarbamoyl transferase component Bud32